jgi:NAD(P)-dependent dehydrogenase (short-subunit alcohol dehydrogenase family)
MSAETLRTRWVLVTGGNKGIGLAIVEGLLAGDFHVFLGSRSLDRATAAVATVHRPLYGPLHTLSAGHPPAFPRPI